jgi:hypothetical protein
MMSKLSFPLVFAIGLVILGWIALGFVGASWLPLVITAVIAGVYLLGAYELRQFRASTDALGAAVNETAQTPPSLGEWLAKVPPALRNAVRLRIEGERGALPGPALTPYLVGLLVMLGMLGTFLGMVLTFRGAVFALEGSGDLQAIRSALAEPIKGLGLSFGTSVAGVAASAMLGLMAAISRRERLEVSRRLDGLVATVLQPFSLVHQRQETFKALQLQARALPEVVDAMKGMIERIESRSQHLDQQLLQRQGEFQREATLAYTALAHNVGASLKESLAAGARSAGETIRPVVENAMTQVVQESQRMHERVTQTFGQRSADLLSAIDGRLARTQTEQAASEQQRLDAWTRSLQAMATELQAEWRRAGEEGMAQQQAVCRSLEQAAAEIAQRTSAQAGRTLDQVAQLVDQSQELVRSRSESESRWIAQHGERMDQLAGLWRSELAALRQQESERGQAAVERLGTLQAAVAQHLATLGAALEAPITRLLHTASEVPQAAAGVIAQLREEMSRVAERDNLALQERSVLLERLGALLQAINQAAGEQRAATEALVESASSVLQQAGTRFAETLDAQGGKAADMAAHIATGALELASLGEAFGQGVQRFQASSDKMIEGLQRVEASLARSTARSDEQLAYYVAQAREVIDLSIASQHGVVENLRQLQEWQATQGKASTPAEEARA